MFSAIAVVFLLSIVIWNGKQTLVEKESVYVAKGQELSQKIEEQEARSISLEEYKKYIKTKKYVEEVAKRYNLIYPDELVFKPSSSN
ncbi:septum formation initiator family protein [[Clostridium] fimetarium]|nr:septum formation initiator family protein [[Clostridium] fimetarium]